jgi:hypothetical protein
MSVWRLFAQSLSYAIVNHPSPLHGNTVMLGLQAFGRGFGGQLLSVQLGPHGVGLSQGDTVCCRLRMCSVFASLLALVQRVAALQSLDGCINVMCCLCYVACECLTGTQVELCGMTS